MTEAARYSVKALDRACDISECLAAEGLELGVPESTGHLGPSRSTVHRILSALDHREFAQRTASNDKYELGIKLTENRAAHRAGPLNEIPAGLGPAGGWLRLSAAKGVSQFREGAKRTRGNI